MATKVEPEEEEPRTIKFMSQTYEVIEDDMVETRKENSFATVDFLERKIYMTYGMKEDAAEEALFHELVHVVEHHLNIPLEEEHVAQLSVGIYHLIKENKLFNG